MPFSPHKACPYYYGLIFGYIDCVMLHYRKNNNEQSRFIVIDNIIVTCRAY